VVIETDTNLINQPDWTKVHKKEEETEGTEEKKVKR
jgi:hypothetical protein